MNSISRASSTLLCQISSGECFAKSAHPTTIRLDRGSRDCPCPLFGEIGRQSCDRDARDQPLEVRGEIHTG